MILNRSNLSFSHSPRGLVALLPTTPLPLGSANFHKYALQGVSSSEKKMKMQRELPLQEDLVPGMMYDQMNFLHKIQGNYFFTLHSFYLLSLYGPLQSGIQNLFMASISENFHCTMKKKYNGQYALSTRSTSAIYIFINSAHGLHYAKKERKRKSICFCCISNIYSSLNYKKNFKWVMRLLGLTCSR